jgi:tRNA modification GTPase
MDLTQAESIADLISAETDAQAKVALEQLQGKLKDAISNVGEPLRNVLAEIEAFIDFPEEDVPPISLTNWQKQIFAVSQKVQLYIDSYQTGKIYKDGANVVLVGRPNVGKSSLLNVLVGEERAIVTPIAGTTRDTIEEHISINGLCIKIFDTAGLVDNYLSDIGANNVRQLDEAEKLGIERSWGKIKNADLVLYLKEAVPSDKDEQIIFEKVKTLAQKIIIVTTKIDTRMGEQCSLVKESIAISSKQNIGIQELREIIFNELITNKPQSSVYITTKRHFDALCTAKTALNEATKILNNATSPNITKTHDNFTPELLSIELRTALGNLNDIIGITTNEDLLGRIFSKFCIGK